MQPAPVAVALDHRDHGGDRHPDPAAECLVAENSDERAPQVASEQGARMSRLIDDLLILSRAEMNEHQAPVGEVRRVFNGPDGTVIYLAEVIYRGDFIRLDMDLRP